MSGNAIPYVTKETFEESVIAASANIAIGVKLTGEWCPPCKALAPIIEEIVAERSDILFVQIEVPREAEAFAYWRDRLDCNFQGIPTVVVFKDGAKVIYTDDEGVTHDSIVGGAPKIEYVAELEKFLS